MSTPPDDPRDRPRLRVIVTEPQDEDAREDAMAADFASFSLNVGASAEPITFDLLRTAAYRWTGNRPRLVATPDDDTEGPR